MLDVIQKNADTLSACGLLVQQHGDLDRYKWLIFDVILTVHLR